jgi:hypothetical protein
MQLFLDLVLNPFVMACVIGYCALLAADIIKVRMHRQQGRTTDEQD